MRRAFPESTGDFQETQIVCAWLA